MLHFHFTNEKSSLLLTLGLASTGHKSRSPSSSFNPAEIFSPPFLFKIEVITGYKSNDLITISLSDVHLLLMN